MNEPIAATAYRFQIRALALGPSSGDSMQNLNTVPLPDGAFVYAIDVATLYVLDKSAVSGGIAPGAGPGRWIPFAVNEDDSGPAAVASTGFNTYAVDGNWDTSTGTSFVLDSVSSSAWALTALGGILTYSGPPRKYLVDVSASVRVGDTTAARDVFIGVGHNADLTGAPTAGTSGEVDQVIPAAAGSTADYNMKTSRVVSLAPGDTVRTKMAGPSGAASINAMIRMMVIPA